MFRTELFSRPRPTEPVYFGAALALLHAMCKADHDELGIRPADFPRYPRQLAKR